MEFSSFLLVAFTSCFLLWQNPPTCIFFQSTHTSSSTLDSKLRGLTQRAFHRNLRTNIELFARCGCFDLAGWIFLNSVYC